MQKMVWSALAAGLVLVAARAAPADDTVRLGGPAAENAVQGDSDTALVHWRGGYGGYRGGYGGFYRGGYGGYRGYGGFYGAGFGYRGYGYGRGYGFGIGLGYSGLGYGGYYRPFFGSNYRPYLYSGCYSPYYASGYYSPYYGNGFYSTYGSYYYPCDGTDAAIVVLNGSGANYGPGQSYVPPVSGTGPFRYDGDPRSIVPMPAPSNGAPPQPRVLPSEGRLVSLPTQVSGGIAPVGLPSPQPRAATPRVTYPAYGEDR